MTKGRKIFIGLCDIASFISQWDSGFRQLGIRTLKGSSGYQHIIQNSKLDFTIQKTKDRIGYFRPGRISLYLKPWWDRQIEPYYFNKAIRECDTFIFIYNSFKTDHSDYKILKHLGKKIVTLFVGDDIRWYAAMKQEFERHNVWPLEYDKYDYSTKALEEKLKYLRTTETYSDIIISKPNMSQLALKPYFNIFIPLDVSNLSCNIHQREIPRIVHAPTSSSIKGSKYVEPILQRLRDEKINFEFKLIENISHEQALKEYLDADIVIDQLLGPGGGALAHECLAMGKVVLTAMAYNKYDQKKPTDCPLVDVDPNTLYDELKSLILNHPKRIELAKQGRPYIEKYHNPGTVVKRVLDILSTPEQERTPDFNPTFFRNQFIPESEESVAVYNKWTEKVKECGWYKKNIEQGERAGLKF